MSGPERWCIASIALLVGLALGTQRAPAQDAATGTEKVKFITVDGVTIYGSFFRGPRAAPAVIMLHPLGAGENRNKKNWVELAKQLSKDFSVLTFDFRGHGESTEIDGPLYCHYRGNLDGTKGARADKSRLDFKDIQPYYYSLFCNDVAAAKAYLERTKNDLGLCNVQDLAIIGADMGATVGAIWANSEWYRYRMEVNNVLLVPTPKLENRPEGKWISAFVFLSITPKFGKRDVNLTNQLAMSCKVNQVPAVFLYSEADKSAKDAAKLLEKNIKFTAKKADPRLALTAAVGLKANEKLTGIDLLQPSLKTSDQIHEWLKLATQTNNEWSQREFLKTLYAWKIGNQLVPARAIPPTLAATIGMQTPGFPGNTPIPDPVEKNTLYSTYEAFIAR